METSLVLSFLEFPFCNHVFVLSLLLFRSLMQSSDVVCRSCLHVPSAQIEQRSDLNDTRLASLARSCPVLIIIVIVIRERVREKRALHFYMVYGQRVSVRERFIRYLVCVSCLHFFHSFSSNSFSFYPLVWAIYATALLLGLHFCCLLLVCQRSSSSSSSSASAMPCHVLTIVATRDSCLCPSVQGSLRVCLCPSLCLPCFEQNLQHFFLVEKQLFLSVCLSVCHSHNLLPKA